MILKYILPSFVCALLAIACNQARALPLTFTNFNVNSSTQSRINLVATADLNGAELTEGPQFAPGGLNGLGSESTLYAQTSSNTPSNMVTQLGLYSVGFLGGGSAQAANAVGTFGNNLAIAPGVGGVSGTAPADYGVIFTSPQNIAIPPIDVSGLNIPGLTTLNLGTLTGINLNVALRNFALDFTSPILGTSGGGAYPQHFDSTQVSVIPSGTSDMSLTATLQQASLTDWIATGAAIIALQQGLAGQGITITSSSNLLKLQYQLGIGFSTPLPAASILNADASMGTIDKVGSNLRLTMPIKFDVQPTTLPAPLNTLITANFAMSGTLYGQTPAVLLPEPSTYVMAILGAIGLAVVGRRRRR